MANRFGSQYWDSRIGGTRQGSMQFDRVDRSSSRDAGQVGAAAGLSTLPEVNDAVKRNSPDWGKMGEESILNRSKVQQAAWEVDAAVREKELLSEGRIEAAEIRGKARADAAKAQGSSAMAGGLLKGAFSIGAALISDETTKNTIEQLDDSLSVLRQLRPVSFYYNEEYSASPERLHYGFIAQEYIQHMPDQTYYDESIGKLCIDTNELIALLVRSIQQLETRVTRMEATKALAGVKS